MKIAIVGAGIFGVVAADALARSGHSVSLFDSRLEILSTASAKNSNRLHLGFHYPRDLETAIQSKEGYLKFKDAFPEACNFAFPCYYALSKESSKTNLESFLGFVEQASLSMQEINLNILANYGFDTDKVSHAWLTQEGVIDFPTLKRFLMKRLLLNGVELRLGANVETISLSNLSWRVECNRGKEIFDFVVLATYGVDNIEIQNMGFRESESMYQATMILQVELPLPHFGVTVIDGDFLTILPKGFSRSSTIYAPGPSVIFQSRNLSEVMRMINSKSHRIEHALLLEQRFREYFPQTKVKLDDDYLVTIRNIESSSKTTDKRVSYLRELAPNLFSIRSGKIDHAISISEEIVQRTQ
jgi:glycine/D-amino acid oxidase-like deaminating enzyme